MMQWVEVNGVTLRYEVAGSGGGAPLVLIHELGGSLESWDLTLDALAEGRRVLRFDERGAGLSEKVRGALALETLVEDIDALLDAVGFREPVDLIGAALGAGVAIGYAVRRPARVRRLVACNPAIGSGGGSREMLLSRADTVEQGGMRAAAEASLARSYPENLRADRARFEWYRNRWIANDPGSFAAHNRMLAAMDETPNLGRLVCPTLVLAGIHDHLRQPTVVEPIADAIPDARYAALDTGHFMAVQTPDLFLKSVLPFLS